MPATEPLAIEDIDPAPVDVEAEIIALIGREFANDPDGAQVEHVDDRAARKALDADIRAINEGIANDDRWRISDDGQAEWAMAKLVAAVTDLDKVNAQRDAYVAKAERWHARASAEPRRAVAYFTSLLEVWALRRRAEEEARNPKHFPKTFHLPSGKVSTRGGGAPRAIITDEAALLAWAREHLPQVITTETKTKVLVTDLRSHIEIIDSAPDPDGAPGPLVVIANAVTPDGEPLRVEDPPGVDYELPGVTPTVQPDLPEE